MFEEELELEKKEGGGFGPLIIIFALVALLVGGVGYVIFQTKQTLKAEDAAAVVTESLKARGPSTIKFHAGHVVPSVAEKPDGPHYRLLEKAGVVKVAKAKYPAVDVSLTPQGEKLITAFPEFAKSQQQDGTTEYIVPLAEREFVGISNIKKISPSRFEVEYTWKWKPNQLGEAFDASGELLKQFNLWERSTLIKDYGADFYHAAPSKVTVVLVKGDKGWKIANE